MTKTATTKRYSLAEVKAKVAAGKTLTRPDAPEADDLPAAFWADAVRVTRRPPKQSVHLRIDPDVLAWFKAQGAGHLTLMNEVLGAYVTAKRGKG